jgi:DNA-binding NarL/FixJ family response regulator
MKRILIADDHSIVRTGISVLIRDEFQNAEIEECSDGNSVWKKMLLNTYDLVILDITMPGIDSVSLLKNIFSHFRDQKILVLSMNSEDIYAQRYLLLGVKGFINKESSSQELRRAITTVMNNKRYLSPRLRNILMENELEGPKSNPFDALSARELQVLTHLLEGKNVTEIAGILCVSTSTVGTHKARIMQKLNVPNLMQLNKMVDLFGT